MKITKVETIYIDMVDRNEQAAVDVLMKEGFILSNKKMYGINGYAYRSELTRRTVIRYEPSIKMFKTLDEAEREFFTEDSTSSTPVTRKMYKVLFTTKNRHHYFICSTMYNGIWHVNGFSKIRMIAYEKLT